MLNVELARIPETNSRTGEYAGRLALASPNQGLREQQLRYDLTTQFAELVDGNMRTNFELRFNGHDLVGEDGRSMDKITHKSLNEAKKMANLNPDWQYEVRRREHERAEFDEIIEMAQGKGPNTMIVVSDFPPELMDAKEDVGGYNVRRKQTMLRVIFRQPGSNVIHMYSQSLDGSNRQALEAIYALFGIEPEPGELLGQRIRTDLTAQEQFELTDKVTSVYDQNLTEQLDGHWYAGRRPADYRNTYDFVYAQTDLIDECVRLNNLGWLNDKFMYGVSAEMQRRFIRYKKDVADSQPLIGQVNLTTLHRDIEAAGLWASQRGMAFSACGVTMRAKGIKSSFKSQLKLTGYGNLAFDEEDEEDWQWTQGECVIENCPTKPDVVEVGPCGVCRRCQTIYDSGGKP